MHLPFTAEISASFDVLKMSAILSCLYFNLWKSLGRISNSMTTIYFFQNQSKAFHLVLDGCILPRYMSSSQCLFSQKKFLPLKKPPLVENIDGTFTRKKTQPIPKISLLDPKGELSVVTLLEAQRLAKRRNYILVQVSSNDPKSGRPVYRLESGTQKKEKQPSKYKDIKHVTVSSAAHKNDILIKIRQAEKWAKKNYLTKVKIIYSNSESDLQIYEMFLENLKDNCILDRKTKSNHEVTFQIQRKVEDSGETVASNDNEVSKVKKEKGVEDSGKTVASNDNEVSKVKKEKGVEDSGKTVASNDNKVSKVEKEEEK